jgi:hypothetical protein
VSDQSGVTGSQAGLWLRRRAGIPAADPVDDKDHFLQLIKRTLGTGIPLGDDVRRRVESWFGRDLGDVRVHDSEQAAALAKRLGAEAFAIKSHVFGPAESLNAKTTQGRGLLAHEITHVVQQTQPSRLSGQSDQVANLPAVRTASVRGGWQYGTGTLTAVGGGSAQQSSLQPQDLPSLRGADGRISLQVNSEAIQRAAEEEAQASEGLVAKASQDEAEGRGPSASNQVDPHEVASRVYRMMLRDLILEHERGAVTT